MIQVVTYGGKEARYNMEGIEQYSLHNIRSLDEYEINVIDLCDSLFWRNKGNNCTSINSIQDFSSVSNMISNSNMSKIVILLPQNAKYDYKHSSIGEGYLNETELKNMLVQLSKYILEEIYQPFTNIKLAYENTKSYIGERCYEAAFYFENVDNSIIKSHKSNKSTVIQMGKIIASTLKMNSGDDLLVLLHEIGLLESKEDVPAWMDEIKMFDDVIQSNQIIDCEKQIDALQQKINISKDRLNSNMRLKSVLYTNGDELVDVVFEILQELLGCDLSEFVDEKKEDFLFEIDNTFFIGEIKGVNHNVKNQNVTQLDVHYQSYLDEHEDINEENIKALLIINHQKSKPISEREPIKDTQINLAERNGSLIIETHTLLRLLEKYRAEDVTREEVLLMLRETEGVLSV